MQLGTTRMHSHLTLHQHLTVEENPRQTLHQQLINQFEPGGAEQKGVGALMEGDEYSDDGDDDETEVVVDDADDDQKVVGKESRLDPRMDSHAFSVYTDSHGLYL